MHSYSCVETEKKKKKWMAPSYISFPQCVTLKPALLNLVILKLFRGLETKKNQTTSLFSPCFVLELYSNGQNISTCRQEHMVFQPHETIYLICLVLIYMLSTEKW